MMMKKWRRGILMLPALMLWIFPLTALGADDEITRRSLKGLKGIFVSVEHIEPGVEKDGLTRKKIRAAVTKRLREAGINVLSKEKWFDEEGSPFLYVNADILKLKTTSEYVYCIQIALKQDVYPVRLPVNIHGAATWVPGGLLGITFNLDKIQRSILDQVDRFVNTYHAVNP